MWPLQKDVDSFYGNPRGQSGKPSRSWEAENLVMVTAPYQLYYDKKPVRGIRVHRKCAEAFRRVFERIWVAAGREQSVVDAWGASTFAGGYVYRNKRGGGTLSMHAYGCAIDLDPARNAMGDNTPNFGAPGPYAVVKAFEAEGAVWGGRWKGRGCDGMHFQFARVNLVTTADLREAGSRTIAASDEIKANAGGALGALATASAMADQVNNVNAQVAGIMSAVESGKSLFDVLGDHWRVLLLLLAIAAGVVCIWRVWRSAAIVETARVDNAREGTPGDQVLIDNPIPGSELDGVIFDQPGVGN